MTRPPFDIYAAVAYADNLYFGPVHSVIGTAISLKSPRTVIDLDPNNKPVNPKKHAIGEIFQNLCRNTNWVFGERIGEQVTFINPDYMIEIKGDQIQDLKNRQLGPPFNEDEN